MVWRNSGEICERKTLFRMKKEADQPGSRARERGREYGEKFVVAVTLICIPAD